MTINQNITRFDIPMNEHVGGVILVRGPGEPSFSRVKNPDRQVISGMAQSGDGNILIAGLGGVRKVDDTGMPLAAHSEEQ